MLGWILAGAASLADAAVIAASHSWPVALPGLAIHALLGLTWLLSVGAFLALRRRGDDEGGEPPVDDPEPPWWPEFERQFRDYARGGPPRLRPPAGVR